MNNRIMQLISRGKYDEIEKYWAGKSEIELSRQIRAMAEETQNLAVYSFVRYMADKVKSAFWISHEVSLFFYPFVYVEGSYSVALFHARELLRKNRSLENLELILQFSIGPEGILSGNEIDYIKSEILEKNPRFEIDESNIFRKEFATTNTIQSFLMQGVYEDAKFIVEKDDSKEEVEKIILQLAKDTRSFCVYSFVRFMIECTNEKFWIALAIKVLEELKISMNSLEGFTEIIRYHLNQLERADTRKL